MRRVTHVNPCSLPPNEPRTAVGRLSVSGDCYGWMTTHWTASLSPGSRNVGHFTPAHHTSTQYTDDSITCD